MNHRTRSQLLFAVSAAATLALTAAAPAGARDRDAKPGEDRYWALLRDGTVLRGREVKDWYDDRREPTLEGKKLFDKNNPLRVLRDTEQQTTPLVGPFVQFANGDVLPGRLVSGDRIDPSGTLPPCAAVVLRSPLSPWDAEDGEMAVRRDQIARVVFGREPQGPIDPGTVVFADGRRVKVRALRWTIGGVRALTDEGSFAVAWLELAEVHPPDIDPIAAVLRDITAPCPEPDSPVARIQTDDGAVLTYRRAMMRTSSDKKRKGVTFYHAVQPAWALEAVRVPFDHIVWRSYREPDEVPLSALPAQTLAQRSYTGFVWPWRRDANVRGEQLVSGDLMSDVGVGTHSYSEVAFALPPGAKRFTARVGIDRGVGTGGCVQVRVHHDTASGKLLWKSDFLRGGQEPVNVDVSGLEKAKRLVLVTDFGHDGRPAGADPADIRDAVDWLMPRVQVDRNALPQPKVALPAFPSGGGEAGFADAVPPLAGWQLADDYRDKVELVPFWNKSLGRWSPAMRRKGEQDWKDDSVLFELTRSMHVTPANAWVEIAAAQDGSGRENPSIGLTANGQPVEAIMNGDLRTNGNPGASEERKWSLGAWADKDIKLSIVVHAQKSGRYQTQGLLWGHVSTGPMATDLPSDGRPIKPDVPITSLKPVSFALQDGVKELQAGKLPDGKPLVVRGYPFADGYAVPHGSNLVYNLEPRYGRFVAVIGLADGSSAIGPYQVYLDDELYWNSVRGVVKDEDANEKPADQGRGDRGKGDRKPGLFGRHTPARQIDVPLPPGHKTITLRLMGDSGAGAWASAGFMTR
jgi:NPCBM/NEW2 domain